MVYRIVRISYRYHPKCMQAKHIYAYQYWQTCPLYISELCLIFRGPAALERPLEMGTIANAH